MKRLLIPVALVAAVVLGVQISRAAAFSPDPVFPVGPISEAASHQIAKLDRVASALAGRRAIVNCWSQRDWTRFQAWQSAHHNYQAVDAGGVTFIPKRRIQLSPFYCAVLAQALARSAEQPLWTAEAVTVLAHESAHASGIDSESGAECRALKTEPKAAELLGLPHAVAVRLQHVYRGTVYPWEEARYRSASCTAGLPGIVVPDTLGGPVELRPLSRMGTAVARVLSSWKNVGGAGGIGPLSPCAPIKSRAWETARFNEIFIGPGGGSLAYTAARLGTQSEFATALARYKAMPRCELALLRSQSRQSHLPGTYSLGRTPDAFRRLSSDVRAYREIWTAGRQKWNRDNILIFDRARRSVAVLFFRAPVGELSISLEARTAEAAIRAAR